MTHILVPSPVLLCSWPMFCFGGIPGFMLHFIPLRFHSRSALHFGSDSVFILQRIPVWCPHPPDSWPRLLFELTLVLFCCRPCNYIGIDPDVIFESFPVSFRSWPWFRLQVIRLNFGVGPVVMFQSTSVVFWGRLLFHSAVGTGFVLVVLGCVLQLALSLFWSRSDFIFGLTLHLFRN